MLKVGCVGASWLGHDCPKEWVEEFNPTAFFGNLVDELNPYKKGEITTWISDAEARDRLTVVSPGFGGGSPGQRVSDAGEMRTLQGTAFVLTVYSQLMLPVLELTMGVEARDKAGEADEDGDLAAAVVDALTAHFASDPQALSADLTAAMAAARSGDMTQLLTPVTNVIVDVISSPDVLTALVKESFGSVENTALKSIIERFGTMAIPGWGLAAELSEAAAEIVNISMGVVWFMRGLDETRPVTHFAELKNDAADALKRVNWSSTSINYQGYVSGEYAGTGSGEGHETYTLARSVYGWKPSVLGTVDGTFKDRPATLVVVRLDPGSDVTVDGAPGYVPIFHANLFAMGADGKPKIQAAGTEIPFMNFSALAWTFEGGTFYSYGQSLQGSSGVAVPALKSRYEIGDAAHPLLFDDHG